MTPKYLIAAATVVVALASASPAAATPSGQYQTRSRSVSCVWSPRVDYVMCATSAMARRGAYAYIDSGNPAVSTEGEVIRGGRRLAPGTELDGAGSVSCAFGRSSVRCTNGESGFKLGAGVRRIWR